MNSVFCIWINVHFTLNKSIFYTWIKLLCVLSNSVFCTEIEPKCDFVRNLNSVSTKSSCFLCSISILGKGGQRICSSVAKYALQYFCIYLVFFYLIFPIYFIVTIIFIWFYLWNSSIPSIFLFIQSYSIKYFAYIL